MGIKTASRLADQVIATLPSKRDVADVLADIIETAERLEQYLDGVSFAGTLPRLAADARRALDRLRASRECSTL